MGWDMRLGLQWQVATGAVFPRDELLSICRGGYLDRLVLCLRKSPLIPCPLASPLGLPLLPSYSPLPSARIRLPRPCSMDRPLCMLRLALATPPSSPSSSRPRGWTRCQGLG